MKRHLVLALALSAVALPAAAQTPHWSASFNLGAGVALAGNVHDGGMGTVLNLPTMVQARDYDQIYGTPFTWSADVGFLASSRHEIRARVFRTHDNAMRMQVGDVATLPLFAEFGPQTSIGMDAGYRHHFGEMSGRIRPFAGASAGFVRIDAIDGTFSVPAASVVLNDVPMYDDSTVPAFALSVGATIPMSGNLGIQGGIDFRWRGDLAPVDGLAGTGLERINDESRQWSMPVTVGAVVWF